jgi:protein-tyrosine phosphatase
MAAALLSRRLSAAVPSLVVESAGVAALVGRPADQLAVDLLRARGIDISNHRARQLMPILAASFELILVMDKDQQRAVEKLAPVARGRVQRLGRFGDFDIPDPYGEPMSAFEFSLAFIERGIQDFVRAFWSAP